MAGTIRICSCATILALAALCQNRSAYGQQAGVNVPLHSAGHSFYENIGVRWGVQGKGWFFNFGGPAPVPGFGGFDPNAQAKFGTSFGNGFFQLTAGQGSSTSFSSQSPSVTVPNGGFGYFSDTTQRPFVAGLVPVVGSEPKSPVRERIERLQSGETLPKKPAPNGEIARPSAGYSGSPSSAERGDLSVAEIKARAAARASKERTELDALIEKGRTAEAAGKVVSARIYYEMASRRTTGDEQQQLLQRAKLMERR